jgi:hypothetical protein
MAVAAVNERPASHRTNQPPWLLERLSVYVIVALNQLDRWTLSSGLEQIDSDVN